MAFLDPLQNIYGVEGQDAVEARLREAAAAFDDLFENCRNTRQVATQASIVSGIDLAIDGAPDGLECDVHFYAATDRPVDILEKLVKFVAQRCQVNSNCHSFRHVVQKTPCLLAGLTLQGVASYSRKKKSSSQKGRYFSQRCTRSKVSKGKL